MIVTPDNRSEIEELRKNKINYFYDKSFTAKICGHVTIGFALVVHYLDGIGRKNKYLSYIWENFLNIFVRKFEEISTNLAAFVREMKIEMTGDQKTKQKGATVSYLFGEKLLYIWADEQNFKHFLFNGNCV